MASRLELQTKLEDILGSTNVYYQPPESLKIKYPCIIYHRTGMSARHADNNPYLKANEYTVNVLDQNTESLLPDKIFDLPMCSFIRQYKDEYINYWVFRLYF